MSQELKRLRVAKKYGEWMYKKIKANDYNDLRFDIYELYKVIDGKPKFENEFGLWSDMIFYAQTGIYL